MLPFKEVFHDAGRWSSPWRCGVRRCTFCCNWSGYRWWWYGDVNGRPGMRPVCGGRERCIP
eukprot:4997043-Pleurochrysis_carterae.AAC.1